MMRVSLARISIAAALAMVAGLCSAASAADWKAGAAKANITPKQLMWMSGYGARDKPAEGKLTDLWAKALVIEDPQGKRCAIVTLDLVGIGRDITVPVRDAWQEKYKLDRAYTAICTSHTHCGPVVGRNLSAMYFLDETQTRLVGEYADELQETLIFLVGKAIEDLAPAELAWGNGRATFAVNRRNNKEPEVPRLIQEGKLAGPFDHDVPVLAVKGADGQLKAIVFGYACHATVLSFYQWCADYPGFAQSAIEAAHPGTQAMFFAGCGSDQNPLPRRTVELAQDYGKRLATAVEETLSQLQPVTGGISASYREIDLPLDKLPTRDELAAQSASKDRYEAQRARVLLARLDAGQSLSSTYPYPVQVWRLGDKLLWALLGGEVVVDYSLRLKKELGQETTWAAGYTNDVMAYIPSRRVLLEGGYEGATAMRIYGLPTTWAPEVEERIIEAVKELSK
ncbi:MAG: neutral/alkaline non-lysosomal ceramidase N-terminal domain-containing protein [Planctomycetes bacterium]|nr:neutral/alkaline non-lysosomal ceramidase N-terminal domain-containing protein [Planctomycetota bacterium]